MENPIHFLQVRRGKIRKSHVELVDNVLSSLTLLVLARVLRPCQARDVPNLRQPLFQQLDAFAHEFRYSNSSPSGFRLAGPSFLQT